MRNSRLESLRYPLIFLMAALVAVVPAYSQTWSASGTTLYYNGGGVGIGTSTPSPYLLDVHGYVHTNLMFLADAPSAGAAGAWIRGATSGSGNLILQANAGTAGAFWLSGSSVLKIGGTGSTEPASGAINITSGGAVGIGTTAPGNLLEVATTAQLDGLKVSYNNTGVVRLHANSLYGGAYNGLVQNGDAGLIFGTDGTSFNYGFVIAPWSPITGGMRITPSGNVLIAKATQTNTSYVLDVNGNARANEVVVNTSGADYVFASGYKLDPLHYLEHYIAKEHHLPGIAPAARMQQEGINLGDNQTQLLAKIEELTLYLIQQDKQTQALKEKIKTLEQQNRTLQDLEQRIERLEHSDATSTK